MATIDLPDGVHRYCVDARVRSAVDILLAGRGPKVPATLEWGELPQFYNAYGAAQRTRIEWAVALSALWSGAWDGLLDGWRASTPLEQLRESDLSIAPDALWGSNTFGRDHRRKGYYADPYAELDVDRGVRLGIGLFKDNHALIGNIETKWTPPEGDEEYIASDWIVHSTDTKIDLTELRAEARKLMGEINVLVDGLT